MVKGSPFFLKMAALCVLGICGAILVKMLRADRVDMSNDEVSLF